MGFCFVGYRTSDQEPLMSVRREPSRPVCPMPASVMPMTAKIGSLFGNDNQVTDSNANRRATSGTHIGLVRRVRLNGGDRQGGQPKKPHRIAAMDTTIAAPTIA